VRAATQALHEHLMAYNISLVHSQHSLSSGIRWFLSRLPDFKEWLNFCAANVCQLGLEAQLPFPSMSFGEKRYKVFGMVRNRDIPGDKLFW